MIALIDELHRATLEKKIIVGKCQSNISACPRLMRRLRRKP